MDPRRFGSSPGELFAPSQTPLIAIDPSHRLVRMTALIDGEVPENYAYDRAGWSRKNIEAHSMAAMKACGLRAIVGFNLNKLVRDLRRRKEFAVAG